MNKLKTFLTAAIRTTTVVVALGLLTGTTDALAQACVDGEGIPQTSQNGNLANIINGYGAGPNAGAKLGLGQTFVAPCTGRFISFQLLQGQWNPSEGTGPISGSVAVYRIDGASTLVGSASYSFFPENTVWHTITLDTPVEVTAGDTYAFFLNPPAQSSGTIPFFVFENLYADGEAIFASSYGPPNTGYDTAFSVRLDRPTNITVDTVSDAVATDGACSLREAIANANIVGGGDASGGDCATGNAGLDRIEFAIPGAGPHTISVLSALPEITSSVTIDGGAVCGVDDYAQREYAVQLDGSGVLPAGSSHQGLRISGGASEITGLVITGFTGYGIHLNSDGNNLTCSYIGLDADGVTPAGNGTLGSSAGVQVALGSVGNVIGGPSFAESNVISANGNVGVRANGTGTDAIIQGNYFGSEWAGVSPLATPSAAASRDGLWAINVRYDSDLLDNTIVGYSLGIAAFSGQGLLIEGNTLLQIQDFGLLANGVGTGQNQVLDNVFGIDEDGLGMLLTRPDNMIRDNTVVGGLTGIQIEGTGNTLADNEVSGNGETGVLVTGSSSGLMSGNEVRDSARDGIELNSSGAWSLVANTISGNIRDGVRALQACPGVGSCVLDGNTIIGNEDSGIFLEEGADRYVIRNNRIGIDAIGVADGNLNGLMVRGGDNQIGPGNTISGNLQTGLALISPRSTGNIVEGNHIGTNVSGTVAVPNGLHGVQINEGANDNRIGGPGILRNVISGNLGQGVSIDSNPYDDGPAGLLVAKDNTVAYNFIGVDVTGGLPLGNGGAPSLGHGVFIGGHESEAYDRPSGNEIDNNLIAANLQDGIQLLLSGTNNRITNNKIGVAVNGIAPLPNGWNGIDIIGKGTGGLSIVTGNTIAHNQEAGIILKDEGADAPYVSATILDNRIFQNGGLGIDLTFVPGTTGEPGDGLNDNDLGDLDPGPNGLINHPSINSVSQQPDGSIVLDLTLTSTGTDQIVEFYKSDASGDEGETFLKRLTGQSIGNASVTLAPGALAAGERITATVTSADKTSEFAPAAPVIKVIPGVALTNLMTAASQPVSACFLANGDRITLDGASNDVLNTKGTSTTVLYDGSVALSIACGAQNVYVLEGAALVVLTPTKSASPSAAKMANNAAGVAVDPNGVVYVLQGTQFLRYDDATGTDVGETLTAAAWHPSGDAYVTTEEGNVFKVGANSPVITGLDEPSSIAFSEDGKVFIATAEEVLFGKLGQSLAVFTPLAGRGKNVVAIGPNSRLVVTHSSARRLYQFSIPKSQELNPGATLSFYLTANLKSMATGVEQSVINAFQSWYGVSAAEVSGLIGYAGDADPSVTVPSIGDFVNHIAIGDNQLLLGSSTLGVASKLLKIPAGGSPEEAQVVTADILLNARFHTATGSSGLLGKFGTDTEDGEHHVQGVVAHELGHVMGLVHSGRPDATMFYNLPREARFLTVDDHAGLARLYPKVGASSSYGTITGQVKSGKNPGVMVGGALLIATEVNTLENVHAYTDRQGRYTLDYLPPGEYRVGLFALDGQVFSSKIPLVPARISRYLDTIANERDFLEEYYNGRQAEESGPNDERSKFTLLQVAAGATVSSIDLITNIDVTPPQVAQVTAGSSTDAIELNPTFSISFSERVQSSFTATIQKTGDPAQALNVTLDQNGRRFAVGKVPVSLDPDATYEVLITGLVDDAGNAGGTETFSFSTRPTDGTAPTVTFSTSDGVSGVSQLVKLKATFSEPISAASATSVGSVQLLENGVAVTGRISTPSSNVIVFSPATALSQSTPYTFSVAGVKDPSGNTVVGPATSTFTTEEFAVPQVALDEIGQPVYGPVSGANGIATETSISVDFTAPIDAASIDGFVLTLAGVPVAGERLLIN
ncbi:MAG: matrixin family metalloprotease, partial [Rhodothermales bacterium]|nr:matrixin family metalloprotease [Rhodothermales bacterium]